MLQYIEEPTVDEDGNLDDNRPVATKHESFGVKLAHQFPWLGSASVAIGLALRRRFLSDPDAPSTAIRRKQITTVCLKLLKPLQLDSPMNPNSLYGICTVLVISCMAKRPKKGQQDMK